MWPDILKSIITGVIGGAFTLLIYHFGRIGRINSSLSKMISLEQFEEYKKDHQLEHSNMQIELKEMVKELLQKIEMYGLQIAEMRGAASAIRQVIKEDFREVIKEREKSINL